MLLGARPLILLTAPFIYGVIVPIALLDLAVAVYQAVCFPIYGIAKVKRRDYIVFDRHRLAYLNAIEKMNCAYCSYANGLFAYVSEVASGTAAELANRSSLWVQNGDGWQSHFHQGTPVLNGN